MCRFKEDALKKFLQIVLIFSLLFSPGLLLKGQIPIPQAAMLLTITPTNPNLEQEVTFTLSGVTDVGKIYWTFGDGTSAEGSSKDYKTIKHTYFKSGVLTVTARYETKAVTIRNGTISVSEKRYISYSPINPQPNQAVQFSANNFLGDYVNWNFGDGKTGQTIRSTTGAHSISHTYAAEGTYTVTVTDFAGSSKFPRSVAIRIAAPPWITYSPSQPKVGDVVTLTLNNYSLSHGLLWDFGDGTPGQSDYYDLTITHIYQNAGTYLVKVNETGEAGGQNIATTTITVLPGLPKTISFTPPLPYANDPVVFTSVNFVSTSLIRWDFGDGNIENDSSPPNITHIYQTAGTYTVTAYDGGGTTVSATATITVRVRPQPIITFFPSQPHATEVVTFNAINFQSTTLIRWDFGDGSIENDTSPPSVVHAFKNPGTYSIRAYDGGATTMTATVAVNVQAARTILFSSQKPRTGEAITFQTMNFDSQIIAWDFGDGTSLAQGSSIERHTYQKAQSYRVTATDYREGGAISISIVFTVFAAEGPAAPFSISYINLRFEDGTPFRVFPKNFRPVVVFADLKFEGTGMLRAQWVVDGLPFTLITMPLTFARQTTIDSGNVPGLPTLTPGVHQVTLNILQPAVEYTIPSLTYYVTVSEEKKEIQVDLKKTYDLDHHELVSSDTVIEVSLNTPFLLSGTVRNATREKIPVALFRVYVEDALVDQKLMMEFKAGEERDFITSLTHSSKDRKKVFIVVYDISKPGAELIFIKSLLIIPSK